MNWKLFGLIVLVSFLLIRVVALFLPHRLSSTERTTVKKTTQSSGPTAARQYFKENFSHGHCQENGPVQFSAAPMNPADAAFIIPLGEMVKGHVTPIDHQYFYPPNIRLGENAPEVPIYAPADGFIVKVNRSPLQQLEKHLKPRDGYDLIIEHSCSFYTELGLLSGITDEMATAIGPIERGADKYVRIPVKAGQQVARVGGQSLDLSVFDANAPAKNWVVSAHYAREGAKAWQVDSFLYYTDAVKQALLAKNPRTVEPRGGRFDYDIDGRLVGSWFLQGTNGYEGNRDQGNDYWRGHLVFAYFALDPTKTEVSMGHFAKTGASEDQVKGGWQFATKAGAPDPKDISVSSGPVKYELLDWRYHTSNGQLWDSLIYQGPLTVMPDPKELEGVILVQMVEDRLLKAEVFPGQTANQVAGFTDKAQLYER